jgi:hypothetical protein
MLSPVMERSKVLPPSPPPVVMLPLLTERKKMLPPSPPPSMGRRGVCRPRCVRSLLPGVGLLPRPARSGRCAFVFRGTPRVPESAARARAAGDNVALLWCAHWPPCDKLFTIHLIKRTDEKFFIAQSVFLVIIAD